MFKKLLNPFRRTRKIQVSYLAYDDLPSVIVSQKTFNQTSRGQMVYESPQELTFLNKNNAVRFIKHHAKPPITRAESIELHPDYIRAKIIVDQEALFRMALEERVTIIETSEEFIFPGSLTFIAKKRKADRR